MQLDERTHWMCMLRVCASPWSWCFVGIFTSLCCCFFLHEWNVFFITLHMKSHSRVHLWSWIIEKLLHWERKASECHGSGRCSRNHAMCMTSCLVTTLTDDPARPRSNHPGIFIHNSLRLTPRASYNINSDNTGGLVCLFFQVSLALRVSGFITNNLISLPPTRLSFFCPNHRERFSHTQLNPIIGAFRGPFDEIPFRWAKYEYFVCGPNSKRRKHLFAINWKAKHKKMTTEKRKAKKKAQKSQIPFLFIWRKKHREKRFAIALLLVWGLSRWKKQPREHEAKKRKYIRKLKWTVTSCERISKLFFAEHSFQQRRRDGQLDAISFSVVWLQPSTVCHLTSSLSLTHFLDDARRQAGKDDENSFRQRQRCTHSPTNTSNGRPKQTRTIILGDIFLSLAFWHVSWWNSKNFLLEMVKQHMSDTKGRAEEPKASLFHLIKSRRGRK